MVEMSDSESDNSLFEFLSQHLHKNNIPARPIDTEVLEGARYVFDNSIDVSLNSKSISAAATMICEQMKAQDYSTENWSAHELHPKAKDESTVDFIFTMDLLNFSFWSEKNDGEKFAVEYRGKLWTGYWSIVAALQRALDEGIPITSPKFWQNKEDCTEEVLKHVFRSATQEDIPLFQDRKKFLRQAGNILSEKFNGSFVSCIHASKNCAASLVNMLAVEFPCFNDVFSFEERERVRFLKRAQICVADLWAAFNGEKYGSFFDIDKITMFADYRVPQILNNLGCLSYSPPLENAIHKKNMIESGHSWEIQIRGCSIWCVELIRQEILKIQPDLKINSILIDFFLYDLSKNLGDDVLESKLPHHRTRSIWY